MNILLSSVGRRTYLVEYFQQALQGRGQVIAVNSSADAPGMLAADVAITVPVAKTPGYADLLLDICRQHQVKLFCSLHDWEAPYLAAAKAKFLRAGIIPVLPELEIVQVCLDKFRTAQFARSLGIPVPACFVEAAAACQALEAGELRLPLLLKPRWGQGSIAMRKVYRAAELQSALDFIHTELQQSGLAYLAGADQEQQVLIQQFVQGQEYGVDIVNDLQGNFAACFVKQKLAMRSGETDVAETVICPTIEKLAKKISAATKHPGNLDADFFITASGEVQLLELNPRFGGGYPFSHLAGANVPAALIAWAEEKTPDPQWLQIKPGVRSFKDLVPKIIPQK